MEDEIYRNSPKSSFGGAQSNCGGFSFDTHTDPGPILSILRRFLDAWPLRKPRSVDGAAPYELRPLPSVPVLEDKKLELRVL